MIETMSQWGHGSILHKVASANTMYVYLAQEPEGEGRSSSFGIVSRLLELDKSKSHE